MDPAQSVNRGTAQRNLLGAQPSAGSFDAYRSSYEGLVENSIAFSGLKHDFFVGAKLALLSELFTAHFSPASPALLDVGCGVGVMHEALQQIVRSLAGTDPSGEAIARAAEEHTGVDYRLPQGTHLPWEDATFDATLAVCVLHHVPLGERAAVIAEMRRVTRRGGLVIIIEHNRWHPLTRLAIARCPFDRGAVLLGARAGRALMKQGGPFARIWTRHFLMLPFAAAWSRKVERTLRAAPIGAQYALVGQV